MSYHHWSNARGAGRHLHDSQPNRASVSRFNPLVYQFQRGPNHRLRICPRHDPSNLDKTSAFENHAIPIGNSEANQRSTSSGTVSNVVRISHAPTINAYKNHFTRYTVFRGNLQMAHRGNATTSSSLSRVHDENSGNDIENHSHEPLHSDVAANGFNRQNHIENCRNYTAEQLILEIALGDIDRNIVHMGVPRLQTPINFIQNYTSESNNVAGVDEYKKDTTQDEMFNDFDELYSLETITLGKTGSSQNVAQKELIDLQSIEHKSKSETPSPTTDEVSKNSFKYNQKYNITHAAQMQQQENKQDSNQYKETLPPVIDQQHQCPPKQEKFQKSSPEQISLTPTEQKSSKQILKSEQKQSHQQSHQQSPNTQQQLHQPPLRVQSDRDNHIFHAIHLQHQENNLVLKQIPTIESTDTQMEQHEQQPTESQIQQPLQNQQNMLLPMVTLTHQCSQSDGDQIFENQTQTKPTKPSSTEPNNAEFPGIALSTSETILECSKEKCHDKYPQAAKKIFQDRKTSNDSVKTEVFNLKTQKLERTDRSLMSSTLGSPKNISRQPVSTLPRRARFTQLHWVPSFANLTQRHKCWQQPSLEEQRSVRDTFSSIMVSSQWPSSSNETPPLSPPPVFEMRMEDFPALPSKKTRSSKRTSDCTSINRDNVKNVAELVENATPPTNETPSKVSETDVCNFLASLEKHCKYTPPKTALEDWADHLNNNIPPTMLTDQFGIGGLYVANKAGQTVPYGINVETLGLNLRSTQPLLPTFKGPFAGECQELVGESNDFLTTSEHPSDCDFSKQSLYHIRFDPNVRDSLAPPHMDLLSDTDLFYIFFTNVQDLLQLQAANELYNRAWVFYIKDKIWITHDPARHYQQKGQFERGYYICYDHEESKFVLKYMTFDMEKIGDRPTIPSSPSSNCFNY